MISNNESLGVALVSYNTNLFEPYDDPDFDPYAQGNFIHDNAFDGNGTNPDLLILAISGNMDPPMPDIVDDGCSDPALMNVDNALTNCLSNNGAATFYMAAMCGGSPSDDINAVTCTHANLPDLPE